MCHCSQCRRWSGNFVAATAARLEDFSFEREDGLAWYESSTSARRGFCRTCGSSLFWRGDGLGYVAIMAGTLDGAAKLPVAQHIFCLDRGGYYDLQPGVPRFDKGGPKVAIPPAQ